MQESKVRSIPEGYHTITPYLVVNNATQLLDFLKEAFDAEESIKFVSEKNTITHSELRIGDSMIMVADAPENAPPMPAMIHLYTVDCDSTYKRALKAGAVSLREPTDQPYGDRMSGVKDSWGNQWWIATHIEDPTPEEMRKRIEAHKQSQSN